MNNYVLCELWNQSCFSVWAKRKLGDKSVAYYKQNIGLSLSTYITSLQLSLPRLVYIVIIINMY